MLELQSPRQPRNMEGTDQGDRRARFGHGIGSGRGQQMLCCCRRQVDGNAMRRQGVGFKACWWCVLSLTPTSAMIIAESGTPESTDAPISVWCGKARLSVNVHLQHCIIKIEIKSRRCMGVHIAWMSQMCCDRCRAETQMRASSMPNRTAPCNTAGSSLPEPWAATGQE